MTRFRCLLRLRDVPAREVAAAHVDDFALLHQHFHGLPHFFPRRAAIDVVHLVEIDVIGLQAAQAFFAGAADVIGGQEALVGPFAHAPEDLGGDDDFLAPTAALREPAPDDLLGDAFAHFPAVDVGGVEEVDAQFQGAIHDGERIFFGGVRAEVHRAQTQRADFQAGAAQWDIVHCFLRR